MIGAAVIVVAAVVAAAEVEKARHQSALDQVEQARAILRQARDDLGKTSIYAPMSGTVSKLNKEQGEICLGSQFQEDVILELSNLGGMEALVDVDENDIVRVSLGDRAIIEVDALPDMVFHGEVTEIASSATITGQGTTDQKTEFEVKIAITDAGTVLRPGMTASAEVVTEVREGCLSVPIQSVTVRTLEQLGAEPTEGDEPRFVADQADYEYEVIGEMRKIRRLAPSDPEDFSINKMESLLDAFDNVMGVVLLVGLAVTGVSLFVGGVGVMNIMLVSVTERTHEIGIRKALGAKRRAILLQFLLEAVVLCDIGGLLGVAAGFGLGNLVTAFTDFAVYVPSEWAVRGIAFCTAVGILFGMWPAVRASRLVPVEALRYE